MSAADRFHANLAACPLVAIIRGVRPDEVTGVGAALIEAGRHITAPECVSGGHWSDIPGS